MFVLYRYCLITILLFSPVFPHTRHGKRVDMTSKGGDIRELQEPRTRDIRQRMFSALKRDSNLKWDKFKDDSGNYVIPYEITGHYIENELEVIYDAMFAIGNNTCVRFMPRDNQYSYLEIANKYNEGCYTTVGRYPGRNILMLEANNKATCLEYDIVLHELLHAVGLWHEHMRRDRDDHIRVHYENIEQDMYKQFEKIDPSKGETYGIPYNYRSIMHYAKNAFAKTRGLVTMETLDKSYQDVIGKSTDAAPTDYYKVCALYECSYCVRQVFSLDFIIQEPYPRRPEPSKEETTWFSGFSTDLLGGFGKRLIGWLHSFQ